MIFVAKIYNIILKFLLLNLFICIFCSQTTAQNCGKVWLHLTKRKILSDFVKAKYNFDIHPDQIQIDHLALPVGIPYAYACQNLPKYTPVVIFSKTKKKLFLEPKTAQAWTKLKEKARKSGFKLELYAAYRNWAEQKKMIAKYGKKVAEKQGYSEHHIGTAIDIADIRKDNQKFAWLLQNAFEYGWIPSYYFRQNSQIKKEAWHWRYVGKLAARKFYCVWEKEILEILGQMQQIKKR